MAVGAPPRRVRRFHLDRSEDATGNSGVGVVAEGCEFTGGWVALTWLTPVTSICFYPSVAAVEAIHGHGGKTRVVFEDLA